MSIQGIDQPEFLQVDDQIRLRRYDGVHDFALGWYQDPETVKLVDGVETPYSVERLNKMYTYLDQHGELYFIEALEDGVYVPIGDVTFWQEDMPIVIGEPRYRGRGIGRKVVSALVQRGKQLGYHRLYVDEIFDYNTGSRRCFESVGFRPCERREKGHRYCLVL